MVQALAKPEEAVAASGGSTSADPVVLCLPEGFLTDDLLLALSDLNDLRLERSAEGALEISLPAGLMSDDRSAEFYFQIRQWAQDGHVAGSSAGFRLPNGAARAPDAAWISPERWRAIVIDDEGYGNGCPDLVVEVRSRGQNVRKQQEKMQEWMAGGARLGWLIDPFTDDGVTWIYREGVAEPERLERPESLSGEDVAKGLRVNLEKVWR